VVRNGFSHDLADGLVDDLKRALPLLSRQAEPLRGSEAASFAHGAGSKPHHTGG
jgi:glutamate decarboxylase